MSARQPIALVIKENISIPLACEIVRQLPHGSTISNGKHVVCRKMSAAEYRKAKREIRHWTRKPVQVETVVEQEPLPPPDPSVQRERFGGFDTWAEYEEHLRQQRIEPKQRRLAETERIVADWHGGGYRLFCELMERATNGGICHSHYARILLPVFLEVIDTEESFEAEVRRTKRRLKLAAKAEKDKARMRRAEGLKHGDSKRN